MAVEKCSFRHSSKALSLESSTMPCGAMKHAKKCMIVTVLYCTAIDMINCCAVLCCAVLCCAVLCCAVL